MALHVGKAAICETPSTAVDFSADSDKNVDFIGAEKKTHLTKLNGNCVD